MIEFDRRDPEAVPLPSPGKVRIFVDLAGRPCTKSADGTVALLAFAAEIPSAFELPNQIQNRSILGGMIRGAHLVDCIIDTTTTGNTGLAPLTNGAMPAGLITNDNGDVILVKVGI